MRIHIVTITALLLVLASGCGTPDSLTTTDEVLTSLDPESEVIVAPEADPVADPFAQPAPELVTLAITIAGQGTVIPQGGEYPIGSDIEVHAIPAEGWLFDRWDGDIGGNLVRATIHLDLDTYVTAVFRPEIPDVTLSIIVERFGHVNRVPQGTPNDTGWVYPEGTIVMLTAVADPGFTFAGWEGSVTSTLSGITVILDVDMALTAQFEPEFIPGDVFSFLSVEDTQIFEALITAANNEITQWAEDERRAIQLEFTSRGGGMGSQAFEAGCDVKRQAFDMRHQMTWSSLDRILRSDVYLDLTAAGRAEVEGWICQHYSGALCAHESVPYCP